MKKIHKISLLLLVGALFCIALQGCTGQTHSSDIYSDSTNWYDNGDSIDESLPDVFYILPTCVFDWTDSEGNVQYYASLDDPAQREAMRPSYELADRIFGDSANFFAPYYRHISLNTWMEGEEAVSERFPNAMKDIAAAFEYYMENWNNGRQFILAGFSQGGKCVVELLKTMTDEEYSRLVAAYVIGYKVTDEDISAASGHIVPAQGRTDTGVTICYNSVTDPSAAVDIISGSNELVINPVNWTTGSTPAPLGDTLTVSVDTQHKLLIVNGLDPNTVYSPSLEDLFPLGNLHLLEPALYQDHLLQNVKDRFAAAATVL